VTYQPIRMMHFHILCALQKTELNSHQINSIAIIVEIRQAIDKNYGMT